MSVHGFFSSDGSQSTDESTDESQYIHITYHEMEIQGGRDQYLDLEFLSTPAFLALWRAWVALATPWLYRDARKDQLHFNL